MIRFRGNVPVLMSVADRKVYIQKQYIILVKPKEIRHHLGSL